MNITELLTFSVKNQASDLHLSAGLSPQIRLNGNLQKIDSPVMDHKAIMTQLHTIMNDEQQKIFNTQLEIDFSFELPQIARFRVNAFHQKRGASAVFRMIPEKINSLDDLKSPAILKELCLLPRGLILITGPTGSGKSTTLAAMVDYINNKEHKHILTIEDPIEFIHTPAQSLINQREVHQNTHSFSAALRSALREDPDVILIGEMRDLETIRLALTAAETGHLVLGTLHTNSAAKTIHRIIDVFPSEEKATVRALLSESLQAVMSQCLLPKIAGGRVAAHELMICTHAIRNLIREDKIAQMYSSIQTGAAQGMQTLDQCLKNLVSEKIIHNTTAKEAAEHKETFI